MSVGQGLSLGYRRNKTAGTWVFRKADGSGRHEYEGYRHCFYALRHAYISEAIENNVPLTVIAENCGTSVRMIEETYAKVLFEKKRDFVEQRRSQAC